MASDRSKRMFARFLALGQTETVLYKAGGIGAGLSILALVDRHVNRELMQGAAPSLELTALNDAAAGIDAAAMDLGTDTIAVAERVGGAPAARALRRVLSQDEDFVSVELL